MNDGKQNFTNTYTYRKHSPCTLLAKKMFIYICFDFWMKLV